MSNQYPTVQMDVRRKTQQTLAGRLAGAISNCCKACSLQSCLHQLQCKQSRDGLILQDVVTLRTGRGTTSRIDLLSRNGYKC